MMRPLLLAAALTGAAAACWLARRHAPAPDPRHEDHLRAVFRFRAANAVPDDPPGAAFTNRRTLLRLTGAISGAITETEAVEAVTVDVRGAGGQLAHWTMRPGDAYPVGAFGGTVKEEAC